MNVPSGLNFPPGQIRSAIVHERIANGESPRSVSRAGGLGVVSASPLDASVDVGGGASTTAGDAVAVDMPWREEADAAIALVEARHGGTPMSDELRDRVYADFAGRAAGLEDRAGQGLSTEEAWANVAAATAANEAATSAVDPVTEPVAAVEAAPADESTPVAESGIEDEVTDPYGTIDMGATVGAVSDAESQILDALDEEGATEDVDGDEMTADFSETDTDTEPGSAEDAAGTFSYMPYAQEYADIPEGSDLGSL